jgi:hypothetical protein
LGVSGTQGDNAFYGFSDVLAHRCRRNHSDLPGVEKAKALWQSQLAITATYTYVSLQFAFSLPFNFSLLFAYLQIGKMSKCDDPVKQ